ncbi:MAG: hypothetical protein DLM69_03390 [Candidatus Chloroheliales bacterium]|nr:MAG: hypothetical protein DLM69_03390 [Chloroflexota bacterium]
MGKVVGIVIAVVVVLAIIIGVVIWLLPEPKLPSLAEFSIVVMAAFSCLGSLLFAALVGVLIWIGLLVKNNVTPLLDNAADTARTAKGTAVFVSEGVVTPIIKVAGAAAGVKAAVQSLFNRKPKSEQAGK